MSIDVGMECSCHEEVVRWLSGCRRISSRAWGGEKPHAAETRASTTTNNEADLMVHLFLMA